MKKLLIIFLGILVASCSDSTSSQYSTYGVNGCGKFISSLDTANKLTKEIKISAYENWIAGYITAYNKQNGGNVIASTDIDGVFAAIVKYCNANPLKDTNDAIRHTIEELKK